ncbi:MAG: transposase [Myxococcota bacterium]
MRPGTAAGGWPRQRPPCEGVGRVAGGPPIRQAGASRDGVATGWARAAGAATGPRRAEGVVVVVVVVVVVRARRRRRRRGSQVDTRWPRAAPPRPRRCRRASGRARARSSNAARRAGSTSPMDRDLLRPCPPSPSVRGCPLTPRCCRKWLPNGHLVWFVLELVEQLDFSPFRARLDAKDPRGAVPYDPRMMVALLLYAYAVGVFSSRRIERATYEDVAFRVLTADQHPDHDTIAAFRREHLDDFRALFVQVLRVAGEMGLVRFGVLGLDGVKILANASKHQAMSYDRMTADVARLDKEIAQLLALAEQTDIDEQARFGDGRPMDLPAELLTAREAMRAKLRTTEGAKIYALRKTTPEPVFGQILEARGFRRFLLRGLRKIRPSGTWSR